MNLNENLWIFNKPITHRGYYDYENPENTAPAYLKSIELGYPIELDVQLTIDNVAVCYHDDNLLRVCGVDKDIRDLTLEEVKKLRPNGKEFEILTFEEVLKLVDGKVPLMVELKSQKREGLEEIAVNLLKNYKGKFAVQSFNPSMVKKVGKLAKDFTLGILATREYSPLTSKFNNFLMHQLMYRIYVKFDFLNVRVEDLTYYGKRLKHFRTICWTCKTDEDITVAEKYVENVIFEKTVTNLGKFDK